MNVDDFENASSVVGPIQTTNTFTAANPSRSASSLSYADFGVLQASAYAEALAGTTDASGRSRWFDDLTVVSAFPVGTPVQFVVTALLSGNVAVNGLPPNAEGAAAGLLFTTLNGPGFLVGPRLEISLEHRFFGLNDFVRSTNISFHQEILTLLVGSTYEFGQELRAAAEIFALGPGGPFSASANFTTTGRFFLDPIGAGYGIQSASGTDHSSPTVPEPSAVMLGLVAAALARGFRRRTKGSKR